MNASVQVYAVALQTIAIILSGIGIVAGIAWNRIITRKRTTIEMLLADQTKIELLDLRSKFLRAIRDGKLVDAAPEGVWFSPEVFPIVSTLNRHEIAAIGIHEGTIDEKILKEYWRSTIVRDWIRCQSLVIAHRKHFSNIKLFCEFEFLARRWANSEELSKMERAA